MVNAGSISPIRFGSGGPECFTVAQIQLIRHACNIANCSAFMSVAMLEFLAPFSLSAIHANNLLTDEDAQYAF